MNLYKRIFGALNEADIKYLIVGGVAVNLYGYTRFTGDIDILMALDSENLNKMDKLMHAMGYVERLPIKLQDLGDAKLVEKYLEEKGMTAFTYISSGDLQLDIDILAGESLKFDDYREVKNVVQAWDLELPVVSIDDLIGMKQRAGRDQDLIDLEMLLKLK